MTAVVSVWKDVCRDLAVASRGGTRELKRVDLVDDLVRAGATVDADATARFLVRLDAASRALDAYANPELTLDSLLASRTVKNRELRLRRLAGPLNFLMLSVIAGQQPSE